jgi:hypothetical protein
MSVSRRIKQWCELSEYPKSPKAHFGRDLRAACPSVRKRRPRDGSNMTILMGTLARRLGLTVTILLP